MLSIVLLFVKRRLQLEHPGDIGRNDLGYHLVYTSEHTASDVYFHLVNSVQRVAGYSCKQLVSLAYHYFNRKYFELDSSVMFYWKYVSDKFLMLNSVSASRLNHHFTCLCLFISDCVHNMPMRVERRNTKCSLYTLVSLCRICQYPSWLYRLSVCATTGDDFGIVHDLCHVCNDIAVPNIHTP